MISDKFSDKLSDMLSDKFSDMLSDKLFLYSVLNYQPDLRQIFHRIKKNATEGKESLCSVAFSSGQARNMLQREKKACAV